MHSPGGVDSTSHTDSQSIQYCPTEVLLVLGPSDYNPRGSDSDKFRTSVSVPGTGRVLYSVRILYTVVGCCHVLFCSWHNAISALLSVCTSQGSTIWKSDKI